PSTYRGLGISEQKLSFKTKTTSRCRPEDLLDRRVRARAIPRRNVRELAGALVEEWGNISQQELANLVQSMRRRCTAVLNAAGGHTRY
uniref:Uncharacterized protein n=1 Tax=Oncorhynchus tshawytscha TaxID=74940 RepID=A0AAZ3PQ11_ONCTS